MNIERAKRSLSKLGANSYLSDYSKVEYVNGVIDKIYMDLSFSIDRDNQSDLVYLSDINLAYVYQERYINVYKDRNTDTYNNGKFTKAEIEEIFKDVLPLMKSYNLDAFMDLKVGDFIGEYDKENKLVDVIRVADVKDKNITAFEISCLSETDYLLPTSFSFKFLIDNNYKRLSKDEVLALVENIEYSKIITDLHNYYKSNNFDNVELGNLLETYRRYNNNFGDFKLFKVYKDNKLIYNPFGNFVFSGHKKIILPIVE